MDTLTDRLKDVDNMTQSDTSLTVSAPSDLQTQSAADTIKDVGRRPSEVTGHHGEQ